MDRRYLSQLSPPKIVIFFVGWYSDEQFTNKYDFTTLVTSSFTLHAKWVEGTEITSDTVASVIEGLSEGGPHTLVATGEWTDLSTLANALKDESKKVNLDLSGVEGLETIGEWAYCSSLTSITIPASVTTIGQQAFYECSSLTSITIPSSVTTIEFDAFNFCSNLATVTFGEGSKLETIEHSAFANCSSLTDINLPSGLTTIVQSFRDCGSLQSITIPASVTIIERGAFSGCLRLATVTMEAKEPPTLRENAFPAEVTSILVPNVVNYTNEAAKEKGWEPYQEKIKLIDKSS